MTVIDRDVSVVMHLASLENIPVTPFPEGFSVRFFRAADGHDAELYRHIWQEADRRLFNDSTMALRDDWFANGFGMDSALHEERIMFIVAPDKQTVGVTTAWFAAEPTGPMALVHYVAMLPAYTGKGLSKPLLAAVLRRQRELGHTECRLGSSTGRSAAVNLYVKFGFMPGAVRREVARVMQRTNPLLFPRSVHPAIAHSAHTKRPLRGVTGGPAAASVSPRKTAYS